MTRASRRMTALALAVLMASASESVAQDATISTVTVNAALEDAANANALSFWPDIEGDLQGVITSMARQRVSDDGYSVSVELEEVSLSGSTVLEGIGEFNHMEGWVYFREPGNSVPVHQHEIVVDAQTMTVGVDESGITVPGVPDFYSGLLAGYGIGVMEQLDRLEPAGSGPQGENRQADQN